MRYPVRRKCFIETCENPEYELCMCVKHYGKFRNARKGRRVFTDKQKHGMSETPEYRAWGAMKSRCYNKNYKFYDYYGGRGIKVCRRWMEVGGFTNFFEDMGGRPKGMSLDRIDVNGHYEPSNCRWATAIVQANNQRMRVTNTSGYKGIHFAKKCNKWCARKTVDGKRIVVGHFQRLEDAINALSH